MSALPQLRIYAADDVPDPAHEMPNTVRHVFEQHVFPRLVRERASPHSLCDYRGLLKKWEEHTGDPPVSAIDDAAFQLWVDTVLAAHHAKGEDGYGNVQKNMRYLKVILRAAVKQGHLTRLPEAFIAAPASEDADEESGRRRIELDEMSEFYEACECASWPGGPAAPAKWRLLSVLGLTFGPRREDLLGLCWKNIHWAPPCPHPKYRKKISSRHGWLVYLPSKTAKRKPQKLYLPLTEAAGRELRKNHTPGAKGPLFGFPRNDRDLHGTRRMIWRQTGLFPAEAESESERPYDFRDLRYTCSCEWNDLWPGLGEHVTGHAPRGVNARHYDQWLKRLVKFARRLEAFSQSPPRPDPQLRLFPEPTIEDDLGAGI